MTVTWLHLATLLLISNIPPNFGAPQGDQESAADFETSEGSNFGNVGRSINVGGVIIGGQQGDQTSSANFDASSWKDPYNSGYSTWSTTTIMGGQCVTYLTIKGNGVDDKSILYPCSWDYNTYSNQNGILITGKDVETNSIYGKQPGQLQIIKEGKCSIRTYKISDGKTSILTTPVEGAECDAMKKEHNERFKKWEEETFPPGFPFHNTNKPGSTNLKPNLKPSTSGNSDDLKPTNSMPKPKPSNEGNSVFSPSYSNPTTENLSPLASQGTQQANPVPENSWNFGQFLESLLRMVNNLRNSISRREFQEDESKSLNAEE